MNKLVWFLVFVSVVALVIGWVLMPVVPFFFVGIVLFIAFTVVAYRAEKNRYDEQKKKVRIKQESTHR
jgi:uncharacterized membrane protein YhaH (DUF805 family)